MPNTTLTGRSIHNGAPISVEIDGGTVVRISPAAQSAADLPYISSGLFDLQVNGCLGVGYRFPDFTEEHIGKIKSFVTAAGSPQHLPTIATASPEIMLRNLRIITRAVKKDPDTAAALPGIHIEGPYISAEDGPRGAHDPDSIRDPSIAEFEKWQDAADGRIVLITLAPELPGALEFIHEISSRGILVSIGHTSAKPEIISQAVDAGARFSTHLGNGSHAKLPRHENYIWQQLAADRLDMGIIPDGFHLPPAVMKSLTRAKGYEKTILTSDVSKMAGMPAGDYVVGNVPVRVYDDGHIGVAGTPFLAGSGHLLDWSIVQFMNAAECSLSDAISMCTENPARVMNMGTGRLEEGAPAHLTLFHYADGDQHLRISSVWRSGKEVCSGI
ncbi:MAG: amidohydrolase family protein [Spirochaetales bacterium]|jgi:N-acetylglucosamine-6-phosphate deacetylase|nr:amidohydrolase family protein [Spirochaetales bacterium]